MRTPTETEAKLISQYRDGNVASLALKLSTRTDIDAHLVLRQIEGWQRLKGKVPSWTSVDGLLYPEKIATEQCSGERAAGYKYEVARRFFPEGAAAMADLTGGLGVDFWQLSRLFGGAVYVERQQYLCDLARHNFPLLGMHNAVVENADAADYLQAMQPVDFIYIDPARRDGSGHKTVLLEDCSPDLTKLSPLLRQKAGVVMAKLSPMLDLHKVLSDLPWVTEAHVFADKGECKDLLLVMADGQHNATRICCSCGFEFTLDEEKQAQPEYADRVGAYLYDPDASIMKAGAFKLVATRLGLKKLHPNTHLYTSDTPCTDFPGRIFTVAMAAGFSKRDLREAKAMVGGKANVAVRNFPATPQELRKRLALSDGGDAYIFAATLADGSRNIIVTKKL